MGASDVFAGFDETRPAVWPNAKPQRFEIVKKGRHYVIPPTGYVVPSVTNILGAIAKPALIYWAANEERDACMRAAADLHVELESVGLEPAVEGGGALTRELYLGILRDKLGQDKEHQKKLKKAADIGTQAHNHIEWQLRKELGLKVGKEPKLSDPSQWAVMAWEDWRNATRLKPIAVEKTVWSQKVLAAGTTDLMAELDLKLGDQVHRSIALADLKTGKAIYPEALLQVAVYTQMLVEMGEAEEDTWGLVVRLPKTQDDPNFETALVPPTQRRALFEVFGAVKKVWEWTKA